MGRRAGRLQGQPPGWREGEASGINEEPDRGAGKMLRVALLLEGGEQISRLVGLLRLAHHQENGILDVAQIVQFRRCHGFAFPLVHDEPGAILRNRMTDMGDLGDFSRVE